MGHAGECSNCHYDTGGAGNISDSYAVAADPAGYSFTYTSGTPSTCSTNACHAAHGQPEDASWAAPSGTVEVVLSTDSSPDNYVEFDATGSSCNGYGCTNEWDFLDGLGIVTAKDGSTLADSTVVTVKYDARGTYRGDLTMTENLPGTDYDSGSATETTTETVAPNPATDFTHTMDPVKRCNLIWTGIGSDIQWMKIKWDDGTETTIVNPAAADSLMHQYGAAGTYVLKVVTLDAEHNTITYTVDDDGDLEVSTL
jgi:hypothetical protein